MRELLVLLFSRHVVLLNCLSVNVASIALTDILNALSASLKNPFQLFSRSRPQNQVELFEQLIVVSDTGMLEPFFNSGKSVEVVRRQVRQIW
jgi:hypothetical protein